MISSHFLVQTLHRSSGVIWHRIFTAVAAGDAGGRLFSQGPPLLLVAAAPLGVLLRRACAGARRGPGRELPPQVLVAPCRRGGADPGRENATGLRGMVQRVESIGGQLEVDSPVGGGTRLMITAPLTPPWGTDGPEDDRAGDQQDRPDGRPSGHGGDQVPAAQETGPAGVSQGRQARPQALKPAAVSAPA